MPTPLTARNVAFQDGVDHLVESSVSAITSPNATSLGRVTECTALGFWAERQGTTSHSPGIQQ